MFVHHDALDAVAKVAIVFGFEAGDFLFQFGDGVVGATAYAEAAEDDHAAHSGGGDGGGDRL